MLQEVSAKVNKFYCWVTLGQSDLTGNETLLPILRRESS